MSCVLYEGLICLQIDRENTLFILDYFSRKKNMLFFLLGKKKTSITSLVKKSSQVTAENVTLWENSRRGWRAQSSTGSTGVWWRGVCALASTCGVEAALLQRGKSRSGVVVQAARRKTVGVRLTSTPLGGGPPASWKTTPTQPSSVCALLPSGRRLQSNERKNYKTEKTASFQEL